MAKGNMLLGFAKGKVGSVIFKRVNGQQVEALKVDPKNPRSERQMIQRIAFASAVKTAKALETIVTNSFEGVEYGKKSKNYFVKHAAKVIANNFTEAMDGEHFGTTCAIPLSAPGVGCNAEIMISKGSIPAPYYDAFVEEQLFTIGKIAPLETLPQYITVGQAIDLFGGSIGNQLTIVLGKKVELDVSEDVEFYGVEFETYRINLKSTAELTDNLFEKVNGYYTLMDEPIDEDRSTPGIIDLLSHLSINNSGYVDWSPSGIGITDYFVNLGVILSAFENGAWKRSTCILSIDTAGNSLTEMYDWRGWNDAEELIALANPAATGTEDRYLNKEKN